MLQRALIVIVLTTVGASSAIAQTRPPRLASVFAGLFGPNGLVVNSESVLPDGSTHSAHFNSAFQSNFTQFNIALASQLTALPLPSPASGFTYRFDASTGTFVRSTQSFGPILTDRAETIGRGRFAFGFNFQHFSFDQLEGVDLTNVPSVFTHDDFQLGGGRADVVTTANAIDVSVGQWTGALTYGLTDRLDVSLVRGANGLTCTARETFTQSGGGGIAMNSSIDGRPMTVIRSRQLSASCRVTRSRAAG